MKRSEVYQRASLPRTLPLFTMNLIKIEEHGSLAWFLEIEQNRRDLLHGKRVFYEIDQDAQPHESAAR